MRTLVFVYGTLNERFSNAHVNAGVRVSGEYETVECFPLYIIGEYYIPWLLDQENDGHCVQGQLFDVDEQALQRMDELEMLDEPRWFTRRQVRVRSTNSAVPATHNAFVYFGATERLHTDAVHLGPIAEFTWEHDSEYRKRAA
jgi:gamma-glutamylaminecyclotransferase